jgi:hypothetical protein
MKFKVSVKVYVSHEVFADTALEAELMVQNMCHDDFLNDATYQYLSHPEPTGLSDEETDKLKQIMDKVEADARRDFRLKSGGFATCSISQITDDNIYLSLRYGVQNDVEDCVYEDNLKVERDKMQLSDEGFERYSGIISGHEVVIRNDSHEHDENECWIVDVKNDDSNEYVLGECFGDKSDAIARYDALVTHLTKYGKHSFLVQTPQRDEEGESTCDDCDATGSFSDGTLMGIGKNMSEKVVCGDCITNSSDLAVANDEVPPPKRLKIHGDEYPEIWAHFMGKDYNPKFEEELVVQFHNHRESRDH